MKMKKIRENFVSTRDSFFLLKAWTPVLCSIREGRVFSCIYMTLLNSHPSAGEQTLFSFSVCRSEMRNSNVKCFVPGYRDSGLKLT